MGGSLAGNNFVIFPVINTALVVWLPHWLAWLPVVQAAGGLLIYGGRTVDNEILEVLREILAELRWQKSRAIAVREMMDIKGVAEYLGQSEHTIREWARMRKIPFHRVNSSIKFRKSRIDKWIDLHEIPMLDSEGRYWDGHRRR
jgi:excisionase family DNA binding protein